MPGDMKYEDLFGWFRRELNLMYEDDEIKSLAFIVLEEILGISRLRFLSVRKEVIPDKPREQIAALLEELKLGTPIQYVLGFAHFAGLKFAVDPYVLIPRPETEELLALVLEYMSNKENQSIRLLDIGTGSGCLAVSLKKDLPAAEVWALDVSEHALRVALFNAETYKTDIQFFALDILDPPYPEILPKFDLIVSNPPYIPVSEKALMRANVLNFEPELALFVGEERPLVFYEAIRDFSREFLKEEGA